MGFEAIFTRPTKGSVLDLIRFTRYEWEKLQHKVVIIGCIILTFTLYAAFRPLPVFDSVSAMRRLNTGETSESYYIIERQQLPIACSFKESRSDMCEMVGDIRIHGNSSTVFMASSKEKNSGSITLKSYARESDNSAMENVRIWKIINQATGRMRQCSKRSNIPGIVFSTKGFSGNLFHEFRTVLIPLYLATRPFNRTVFFLMSDKQPGWIKKHKMFFKSLSKYSVMDIDSQNKVLCFPKLIIGLKGNRGLDIDPRLPPYYSLMDFANFLRSTYSLERESVNDFGNVRRPRMLIISREETRIMNNEDDMVQLAGIMGFDVVLKEEWGYDVQSIAKFVNSFDVIVGVYGAELTSMVYLPRDAVVIQIVPFGLEMFSHYYRKPAEHLRLRYLEYKVSLNESSLLGQYQVGSQVYTNPRAVLYNRGYEDFKSVYMDSQDVDIDITKFRDVLFIAGELLLPS
uniref:GT61_17 n=1 Tax=Plantago ovata TaxID=185002 RepID=A0A1P8KZY8_PLAOV|nr:GT61_17 [Plantago ovata]